MGESSFPAPVADYVFLSDPALRATYCVERSGRVRRWREGEAPFFLGIRRAAELPRLFDLREFVPDMTSWRWQEDFLPVLTVSGPSCRSVRLAADDAGGLLLETAGRFLRWPGGESVSRECWAANLDRITRYWRNWFAAGTSPDDPAPDWKSSLVQAKCAFCGRHPKYGVETYADFRSDGFPPTILAMAETVFRYGHEAEARELFGYWLERFIRADGTVDYYGPSVSEYGDLLRLGALLGAEDRAWMRENVGILLRIAWHLYDLMNSWTHPEIRETFLLIRGVPEADTRESPGAYFHNNLAVLRGFYELSGALAPAAAPEAAAEMRDMAEILAGRLTKALAALRELPFPPWRADIAPDGLSEKLTDSCEAAYANYRYYPEMLQSGLLSAADALRIVRAREERGGEEFGMTVFRWPDGQDWLDDWPIASYARGLLEYGERERFEKVLDGHRRFYQSPDTFTAYEAVTRTGSPRTAATDWCVPVQLALPLMLILRKGFRAAPEAWRLGTAGAPGGAAKVF